MVRRYIVGEEDVVTGFLVEVGDQSPEGITIDEGLEQFGVGKSPGSIPLIPEDASFTGGESFRMAEYRFGARRGRACSGQEVLSVDVGALDDIGKRIAVEIGGLDGAVPDRRAGRLGQVHLLEGSVSLVAKPFDFTDVGCEQIVESVLVEVCDRGSLAVAKIPDACLLFHCDEAIALDRAEELFRQVPRGLAQG